MNRQIDNLHTEDVIQEVKKYEVLWNPNLEDYQNKVMRSQAWVNVILKFFPDFNERTTAEKSELDHGIRKRWKSIRTCYAREIARIKNLDDVNCAKRRKYQYFDQLKFLEVGCKGGNALTAEVECEQRPSSPNHQDEPSPSPASRPQQKIHTNKRKADVNQVPVHKRKVSLMPKIINCNYETERDADRMFLLSLVPDLQRVPIRNKLNLKLDILNAILKAQQDLRSETEFNLIEDSENQYLQTQNDRVLCENEFLRNQEQNLYSNGLTFIKVETAESHSSLGSPEASEECDDVFPV